MSNLENRFLVTKDGDFAEVRRYLEANNASITYKCKTIFDPYQKLEPNSSYFFKVNTTRGSKNGATSESHGTCEDVAEVFSYYLIKNLSQKIANPQIDCAWYDFAEFFGRNNREEIYANTEGLIESNRQYGCLSKDVLKNNEQIVRGNMLLSQILNPSKLSNLQNNTLYNYHLAIKKFEDNCADNKTDMSIAPNLLRYISNEMFMDYFLINSDRHSGNITFKDKFDFDTQKHHLMPTKIIDNGASFLMLSYNCFNTYSEISTIISNCKEVATDTDAQSIQKNMYQNALNYKNYLSLYSQQDMKQISNLNPTESTPSLKVGEECFADNKQRVKYAFYEKASHKSAEKIYDVGFGARQIALLISQNKILCEDFKNIYQNLDPQTAYRDMLKNTVYDNHFLPGFNDVVSTLIILKKAEISEAIADQINIPFNQKTFVEDPNYYVEKLSQNLEENHIENNLTIHISSDEEQKMYYDKIEEFENQTSFEK